MGGWMDGWRNLRREQTDGQGGSELSKEVRFRVSDHLSGMEVVGLDESTLSLIPSNEKK